jgi:hypothetical protein
MTVIPEYVSIDGFLACGYRDKAGVAGPIDRHLPGVARQMLDFVSGALA